MNNDDHNESESSIGFNSNLKLPQVNIIKNPDFKLHGSIKIERDETITPKSIYDELKNLSILVNQLNIETQQLNLNSKSTINQSKESNMFKTLLKALKNSASNIIVTFASLILISIVLNIFLSHYGIPPQNYLSGIISWLAFTVIGFFIGREYQKLDVNVMK